MITNEQFLKLPRWAQNEINKLRNDLERAERHAKQISGESATNTHMLVLLDKKPLPSNSNIEFTLPDGRVTARVDGEKLYVTVPYGRLNIQPTASNGFYIHLT